MLVFGIARARQKGQKNAYVLSTWGCILLQTCMLLLCCLVVGLLDLMVELHSSRKVVA